MEIVYKIKRFYLNRCKHILKVVLYFNLLYGRLNILEHIIITWE